MKNKLVIIAILLCVVLSFSCFLAVFSMKNADNKNDDGTETNEVDDNMIDFTLRFGGLSHIYTAEKGTTFAEFFEDKKDNKLTFVYDEDELNLVYECMIVDGYLAVYNDGDGKTITMGIPADSVIVDGYAYGENAHIDLFTEFFDMTYLTGSSWAGYVKMCEEIQSVYGDTEGTFDVVDVENYDGYTFNDLFKPYDSIIESGVIEFDNCEIWIYDGEPNARIVAPDDIILDVNYYVDWTG